MDYKPPFKDEIPGIYSFLYEANRFRKPHEYIGYEERLAKMEGLLRGEGIDVNLEDMVSVAQKLIDLYEECAKNEKYAVEFYNVQEKLSKEKLKLQIELQDISKEVDIKRHEAGVLDLQRIEALSFLLNYGDHKPHCGYLEVLESGRALDVSEKEECTCGWIQLRDKIVRNPDNFEILEGKSSSSDPLNGKPLKELRELDID